MKQKKNTSSDLIPESIVNEISDVISLGIVTHIRAIFAGMIIGMFCILYLSSPNHIVGATLFGVGMLAICAFDLPLFTNRIGYLFHTKRIKQSSIMTVAKAIIIWIGNLIGTNLISYLIIPTEYYVLIDSRLDNIAISLLAYPWSHVLCMSMLCGLLSFLIVEGWQAYKNTCTGVILVSGLAMSFVVMHGLNAVVAMFTIYAARSVSFLQAWNFDKRAICTVLLITLGNTIGACIMSLLLVVKNKKK